MKKKVYSILFYFFVTFLVNQNLLSNEKYKELDRVVAIVEKEVITEMELKTAIKQVLNSKKNKDGSGAQYTELVRANVLDQLIQKSLIEQYAAQYGIKVEQKKIDAFLSNIAKKYASGRELYILEGGYVPENISKSAEKIIGILTKDMGD